MKTFEREGKKIVKDKILRVFNNNYFLLFLFLGFIIYNDLGFYSKAPDTEFEGSTSLVIRSWNEPFFNSEERFCISTDSEDNPVCPEVASAYREKYSVLIDLPWWKFAHDMSLKNLSDQ